MKFYIDMLNDKGCIELKTDDRDFFEYSFSQMKKFGLNVVDLSKELIDNPTISVPTEYEIKFKEQGLSIYYLKASK